MRIVTGRTMAGGRLVQFQVILGEPNSEGKFESASVVASRVIGKPYQCPKSELALVRGQVLDVVNGLTTPEEVWRDDIEATARGIGRGLHSELRRASTMANENTTKSVKEPKPSFGQCQVRPLAGSKAGRTQCPRPAADNEHRLCSGHQWFLTVKNAEIELVDGTILNPRPKVEPKVEPKADTAGLVIPEGITAVTLTNPTPESVAAAVEQVATKAGKKRASKKDRKAEPIALIVEHPAIAVLNRTLPNS